jgi:hypothetical protein
MEEPGDVGDMTKLMNWLKPLPSVEDTRRKRHACVSQDPRCTDLGLSAADDDAECT